MQRDANPPRSITANSGGSSSGLHLASGSRVAIIGGGPAGSFFAYFLLDHAGRVDREISVDIYEPRDYTLAAPRGCNMCGGIVSESLVQTLAAEGIDLPPTVVQRGIDSYMLHMDVGRVRIETPLQERRIAAVHRGPGPRDVKNRKWGSFDDHLLTLATSKGANAVRKRVENISRIDGGLRVSTKDSGEQDYDLVAVAVGVNSNALRFLQQCEVPYHTPKTTKTFISEYFLGQETIQRTIGNSMHVFLLDIPRLKFAAIIPKGDYATVCLLGNDIDKDLIRSFLDSPQVRCCFPSEWDPEGISCQCGPRINLHGTGPPFADRVVYIGDCGVTRLYKDGIGAAYRTAKAAASTVVFQGIGASDFRRHYLPRCKAIARDNAIGMLMFSGTGMIHKVRPARRAMLSMISREQEDRIRPRRLSQALWDLFTGSASYKSVLTRSLHPGFLLEFARNLVAPAAAGEPAMERRSEMETGTLGKIYEDGESLVRQGEVGESMYVILEGEAQVLLERDGQEVQLRTIGPGELIGEMAVFERVVRSATVRASGRVRALTIDKDNLLRRIQEDPTLAFRIIQTMSQRIRELSNELGRYKN